MNNRWWYARGGQKHGPAELEQLNELYLRGELGDDTLVWTQGMPQWAKVRDVAALASFRQQVPPELPAAGGSAEPAAFADTAPDQHLSHTGEPPAARPSAADADRERWRAMPLAGPWRRFFARMVDLFALAFPCGALMGFIGGRLSMDFALWLQSPDSSYAFGMLVLPFAMVAEAVIFAVFATTPGKALLGLRVVTVGLTRPTFAQYLKRQAGVWWYGLAMGVPLVNLFTMAIQHGKLKRGEWTVWDRGAFNVKGLPRLGVGRGIAVTLVVAAILVINGALQGIESSNRAAVSTPARWTNPETGRAADIPAGWMHAQERNAEGNTVHSFSHPRKGLVVVFAAESAGALGVAEYGPLWARAVQEQIMIVRSATVDDGTEPVWLGTGTLRANGAGVSVRVVGRNGVMWRLVVVRSGSARQEDANELQRALGVTIGHAFRDLSSTELGPTT